MPMGCVMRAYWTRCGPFRGIYLSMPDLRRARIRKTRCQLADEVYSVERIKALCEQAKNNLRQVAHTEKRLPLLNLRLHYGDGRLGLAAAAPFDAIVIAAAGMKIPD